MSVYVRYPCPNCPQHLSLRLEYVNRRVICNYCKHRFLSRAKIRVPESAAQELVEAIHATNQAQGFGGGVAEGEEAAWPLELVVLGDLSLSLPRLEGVEVGDAAAMAVRVAELERSLARAEIRFERRLEQARLKWEKERRALEEHTDRLCVRYSRQFDDERVWQARRRAALRRERDAALRRVAEVTQEQERLRERLAALEATLARASQSLEPSAPSRRLAAGGKLQVRLDEPTRAPVD